MEGHVIAIKVMPEFDASSIDMILKVWYLHLFSTQAMTWRDRHTRKKRSYGDNFSTHMCCHSMVYIVGLKTLLGSASFHRGWQMGPL